MPHDRTTNASFDDDGDRGTQRKRPLTPWKGDEMIKRSLEESLTKGTKRRSWLHGEEGLRWLIELTSVDVKKLAADRPADVANLVYDLERWLGVRDDGPLTRQIRRLLRRPALFQPLVDKMSAPIAAVADRRRFSYRYSDGHVEVDANRLEDGAGRMVSSRFTDLLDAVMHVAIQDLDGPYARLGRRCQEEPCHRISLPSRRSQIYCSHRCANSHASRNYRAANRRKRAERERERYRRRVISRLGGGAIRVGRRLRSKESRAESPDRNAEEEADTKPST